MKTQVLQNLKNKYILLRHGQTDANKQKIYMGRLDYSLNEEGRKQAGSVILPFAPDLIISSPLKRTRETADIILSKTPIEEISVDDRIIEKSGGEIEGKTYDIIAQNYPEAWNIWESRPLDFILKAKFPAGESDEEVSIRLEEFFTDIENQYQDKTILLVTHSGVIQAIRYLIGKNKEAIYLTAVPSCHIEIIE